MASAIDIGNVQQINPIHQSTYINLIHPSNRFHQLSMCIVNLHFIGFDAFNQQLSVGGVGKHADFRITVFLNIEPFRENVEAETDITILVNSRRQCALVLGGYP